MLSSPAFWCQILALNYVYGNLPVEPKSRRGSKGVYIEYIFCNNETGLFRFYKK